MGDARSETRVIGYEKRHHKKGDFPVHAQLPSSFVSVLGSREPSEDIVRALGFFEGQGRTRYRAPLSQKFADFEPLMSLKRDE